MPYEEFESLGQPNPQDVSKLYREWLLAEKAKKFKGKYGGQCVVFARKFVGATSETISGVAKNIPTNSTTPQLGAIVKTNESRYGHLAVVIALNGENLTLVESNYGWTGTVSLREIKTSDPKIQGYIINN